MPTRAPCLLFDELWNWQSRCWKNSTVTGWDNVWWGEMSIFKTLPVTPSLGGNIELQNITAVLQISICQPGFHQAVDTARLNSSRAHKTHVTTVWNHVYRFYVVAVKKKPFEKRITEVAPSFRHALTPKPFARVTFPLASALRVALIMATKESSVLVVEHQHLKAFQSGPTPSSFCVCGLQPAWILCKGKQKKKNKSSTNCHLSLSSRQRPEPVAPHRPDKISFCHKMKPSRSLCVILSQASGDRRMKPGLC